MSTAAERLIALDDAPGTPTAKLVARLAVSFEGFLADMGCPLDAEQVAALAELREAAA